MGYHSRERCHAAVEATETAAPEATEAATATSDPIADMPNHGYEPTREAVMARPRQARPPAQPGLELLAASPDGSTQPLSP